MDTILKEETDNSLITMIKDNITIISICVFVICLFIFSIHNEDSKTKMNPKIPRIIYQTYKHKNIPEIIKNRWLQLNPDYEYKFFDDKDCVNFLLYYFGNNYSKFFTFIKDGPIKSDFWRLCVLYEFGGVYADTDVIPIESIDNIVNYNTTLFTSKSSKKIRNNMESLDKDKNLGELNPLIIAVTPKNPIILNCINTYMKDLSKTEYNYYTYSITNILSSELKKQLNISSFDENIYHMDDQIIQLSEEKCSSNNSYSCYIEENNKQILICRDKNLYDKEKHEFYTTK